MSKRLLSIEVRGTRMRWSFPFYGDPRFIPEWEADGLVVTEILNTIPEWFPWPRMWCFFQDLLNFKNPWSSR